VSTRGSIVEGSLPFTVHCIQEKGITIQQEHRHLNLAPISCPMQEGESLRVDQPEKLDLFCKLSTNLKGESMLNIHNC